MSLDEALALRRRGHKLRGWKEIAAFLELSEDTAQARADTKRNIDPIPVRYDYRGPYAWESAIMDWVERNDESHAQHMSRKRRSGSKRRASATSG